MKQKKRSEIYMADAFEKDLNNCHCLKELPIFHSIFREVICKQGIPDIIAVNEDINNKTDLEKLRKFRNGSAENAFRIISLLKRISTRTEEYITKKSGLSKKATSHIINRLRNEDIIEKSDSGSYRLSSNWEHPQNELWAFELKLNDWKRALFQALQYKAFAHRVIMVFPMEKEAILSSNSDIFIRMSVGVMLYDPENHQLKILHWPKKRKPESTIHYLHAVLQIAERETSFLL